MELSFFQVDVFTDRALGGNPLAVFFGTEALNAELMQKIAREMNLSETTFVFPGDGTEADFDVRIFTPGKEIPFAGHPTLGTAHILYETGRIPAHQDQIRLGLKSGVVSVTRESSGLWFMEQPRPEFGQNFDAAERLALSLGLEPTAIDPRWPAQVVSTGFPALFVPLVSLEAAQSVIVQPAHLGEILDPLEVDMIYVFTRETAKPEAAVHARAFAPFIGIDEDPATGSAAGALGGYLAKHHVMDEEIAGRIRIEQGYEINRPACIHVKVNQTEGTVDSVQVGGGSQTVIEGRLTL